MSKLYRIQSYLQHLRKAKNRHGIHSPFVYAFSDQVMRRKEKGNQQLVLQTVKYPTLISRIIQHFQCSRILWLTNKEGEPETLIHLNYKEESLQEIRTEKYHYEQQKEETPLTDMLLIDLPDPQQRLEVWQKYREQAHPHLIVLLPALHESRQHSEAWKQLYEDEKVRLSLDLFYAGLLFFQESFKEKQHFLLK